MEGSTNCPQRVIRRDSLVGDHVSMASTRLSRRFRAPTTLPDEAFGSFVKYSEYIHRSSSLLSTYAVSHQPHRRRIAEGKTLQGMLEKLDAPEGALIVNESTRFEKDQATRILSAGGHEIYLHRQEEAPQGGSREEMTISCW